MHEFVEFTGDVLAFSACLIIWGLFALWLHYLGRQMYREWRATRRPKDHSHDLKMVMHKPNCGRYGGRKCDCNPQVIG